MKKTDVIRAWRDEEYRDSLSDEQRAALPASPAGTLGVDDDVLRSVAGGCCDPGFETTILCSCKKPWVCP